MRPAREEDAIVIGIENPVPSQARNTRGHRMAQDNVRQRLAFAHGELGVLETSEADGQYRVVLRIPWPEATP